ncbi:MAG: ADP-forming succinate--CoA ligase subunit beta [Candidatus Latescibacterota bacterium]|jgi:succinyl-CoA synthetase beta subunit
MKIHEYQAKELLRRYQVPVPPGQVARTPEEATVAAATLGGAVVVKAQIHAGGRGKGGGIRVAATPAEAGRHAEQILGMQLVTHQTGPQGQRVKQVLVEQATRPVREQYLAVTLDRSRRRLVVIASQDGGVEIEQVAALTPERILREEVDPGVGLLSFQANRLAGGLGLSANAARAVARTVRQLYELAVAADCALVEINPLVLTETDEVLALDAKVNLDDNALFRHPELAGLRDQDEEDPLEVEASAYRLNYIKLDGQIACMVNGAGLAMATMDIVKLAGGEPANFLDVGGGASAETVENGFRILLRDPGVRAILINIFGGIVRCDRVAEGVIQARRQIEVQVPVVVRLAGTNAELAARLLAESGLRFQVAQGLAEAARAVVAAIEPQGERP